MSSNYVKRKNGYSGYESHGGARIYDNNAFVDDSSFQTDDFGHQFSNFNTANVVDYVPAASRGSWKPGSKRGYNDFSSPTPTAQSSFPSGQSRKNWNTTYGQTPERTFNLNRKSGHRYDYGYDESDVFFGTKRAKGSPASVFQASGDYGHSNQYYGGPFDHGNYVVGPSGYGRPVRNQPLLPNIPQVNTTEISPYYGIQNISAPGEDNGSYSGETSVHQQKPQDVGTSNFDPQNPYGKWKPAQEDEEDIECLTHDAQIIAGIEPDRRPASMDAVQKAMEIEVTVPSELMQADLCQLCQAQFSSPQMAESHYLGKKHAQRENQYVRKIYEEKGINVTRFLAKPTAKFVRAEKKATPVRKKFNFSCNLCNLGFENQEQVDLHVTGALHRKKVFDRRSEMLSATLDFGTSTLKEEGQLYCSICDKVMNSQDQFNLHVNSKKHKAKEATQQSYY